LKAVNKKKIDQKIKTLSLIRNYSSRQREIIKYLYYNDAASLREISLLLNVTHPTTARFVEELVQDKVLISRGEGLSSGGRRSSLFGLNPDAGYIICVDAGRLNTRLAILNLNNTIISEREFRSRVFRHDDGFLGLLKNSINEMIGEEAIHSDSILGMGVGIPGFVNTDLGRSYSFLDYYDKPIKQVLEDTFDIPVVISNDVNLMTHAEHHFGAAREYRDAIVLNLGWGIGIGLLLNGSVYLGARGFAGEFGHIQVEPDGEPCHCGKIGCLETVASGEAIARVAIQKAKRGEKSLLAYDHADDLDKISARKIVDAAKQGDDFSIGLLHDSGDAIGRTLASVLQILNPAIIILGGKHARAGKLLTNSIEKSLLRYTNPKIGEEIIIAQSDLGGRSNILGAAGLVMEKIVYLGKSSDN